MKFEYFVGKEIGEHGGKRFEVNAGWQLRIGLRSRSLRGFEEEEEISDELKSLFGMDYGRVICISSSTQWLEVLQITSSLPDFLEMTSSRF